MFKIGLFPHGVVTPVTQLTPAPTFDGIYADNSLAVSSGTYYYYAYQATSINVPIQLSFITDLDFSTGQVYYQITSSWAHYNGFTSNIGPFSPAYGTFINMPTSALGQSPDVVTVNPNQWIILAVDGTVPVKGSEQFTNTIINISNSNTTYYGYGYYNLQAEYPNPLNINPGPQYDSTNEPMVYFYSGTDKITGLVDNIGTKLLVTITEPLLWDSIAQLYYRVDNGTPPLPSEAGWSMDEPAGTYGYTAIVDGQFIFNVQNNDYIRFAVAGKVTPGNANVTVTLENTWTQGIASFNAFANVTPAP